MNVTLTNRGLLRAVVLAFALFLAYRFAATVLAILLLFAAALLLAVILSAPVEALYRRSNRLSRPAITGLLVLAVLAVLGLGGALLVPVLANQASQVASQLPGAFYQLVEQARSLAQSYGFQPGSGGGGSSSSLSSIASSVLGGIFGLFSSLASLVTGLLVLLLVPIYLVAQPEPAVEFFVRFFPLDRREGVRGVLAEVRSGLLSWLKGRLVSMAVIAVLATVALYIIGVPGALFLGLLTGLLEFVPLVGPIVAAVPPLLLAFVGGPLTVLWVLLTYLGIQQIESNLLEPLVMEETVSLHPAAVIAAVTVVGAAFGILGTILAVPVIVVATVLIKELWFGRLEEGKELANQTREDGKAQGQSAGDQKTQAE